VTVGGTKGCSSLNTLTASVARITHPGDFRLALKVLMDSYDEVDADHAADRHCYQYRCRDCDLAGRVRTPEDGSAE
jgi:hypothetical protein